MNPAFRALQKRNQKLEQQNAALKLTFDRMLSDIELTESLGCAFAWDLQVAMEEDLTGDAPYEAMDMFEAALKAGEDFQEARKWLRDQLRGDREFKKTAVEAAGKDPNMEIETPFGRYSLRTLSAT